MLTRNNSAFRVSCFKWLIAVTLLFISNSVFAEQGRADYDLDDDGLIEINDLADLNEIRNHLDGSALYGLSTGCPDDGCRGFELTATLNFDTDGDGAITQLDDYWNEGKGWLPLGSSHSAFVAVFNGNNYQIKNLYINRPDENAIGLFGNVRGAAISSIGLTGHAMAVHGAFFVGGLLGTGLEIDVNQSYSTGDVYGGNLRSGGLIGGVARSTVKQSFSSGRVFGEANFGGGLIGTVVESSIAECFSVSDVENNHNYVGGLIGYVSESSLIHSYSIGSLVTEDEGLNTGGLVGLLAGNSTGSSQNYWDIDTSRQHSSSMGVGYTTEDLQCPEVAGDSDCHFELYSDWDESVWDFGTASEYPVLIIGGIPSRDTDGDDVWDFYDAFPDNAAASVDTDADQLPDKWNAGCDELCQQQSGLTLDDDLTNVEPNEAEEGSSGSLHFGLWLLLPVLYLSRRK